MTVAARGHHRFLHSRRAQRKVAEFFPFRSKREQDALKRYAKKEVDRAFITGALIKQPCEQCGWKKAEAHHDDYAQPLNVKWLCRLHHRVRDAELREARRAAVRTEAETILPVAVLKRLEAQQARGTVDAAKLKAIVYRTTPRHMLACDAVYQLICQATVAIAEAMDAERIPETVLAKRCKVSRQHINTSFAGGIRTLKALAVYADALGYDAMVVLRKRDVLGEAVSA